MNRPGFMGAVAGVFAALALPFKAKAVTPVHGRHCDLLIADDFVNPSMRPRLKPNAIVKYEHWREWEDHRYGPSASYVIRYTVVPTALIAEARRAFTVECSFIQVTPEDPDRPGYEFTPQMYIFTTYGSLAYGHEEVEAMREDLSLGRLKVAYHSPGTELPRYTPASTFRFQDMIAYQAAFADADYTLQLKRLPYTVEDICREMSAHG